jgi:hypothetical protein
MNNTIQESNVADMTDDDERLRGMGELTDQPEIRALQMLDSGSTVNDVLRGIDLDEKTVRLFDWELSQKPLKKLAQQMLANDWMAEKVADATELSCETVLFYSLDKNNGGYRKTSPEKIVTQALACGLPILESNKDLWGLAPDADLVPLTPKHVEPVAPRNIHLLSPEDRALLGIPLYDDDEAPDGDEASEKSSRFTPVLDHQFVTRAPLAWHIKGVLPNAELIVVYGASGSGKSFLVFDMVAAVATGASWQGRKTTKGRVVYVVAEGATGFLNRLKAYTKTRSGSFPGIRVVADAPNLLGKTDHASLATEIGASGGAGLIVIDTLAASSPGADENAAKDMGRVIEHCKQLHKATGATVLLIHHSGKDESKGARGWSGLRAAADAEIEVSRCGDYRVATVTKMKDGEDGAEFAFKLVPVEIGVDADGDPVTSCVVEPLSVAPAGTRKKEPPPGTVQRALLDAIRDDPSADQRVSVSGVIEAAMLLLPTRTGRDLRRQHLKRALGILASKGFITVEGDICRAL